MFSQKSGRRWFPQIWGLPATLALEPRGLQQSASLSALPPLGSLWYDDHAKPRKEKGKERILTWESPGIVSRSVQSYRTPTPTLVLPQSFVKLQRSQDLSNHWEILQLWRSISFLFTCPPAYRQPRRYEYRSISAHHAHEYQLPLEWLNVSFLDYDYQRLCC